VRVDRAKVRALAGLPQEGGPALRCADCGREVDALAVFPGGRCLECHAAIVERLPLERPDFIGAIATEAERRRRGLL
jgi:hypothetical protein